MKEVFVLSELPGETKHSHAITFATFAATAEASRLCPTRFSLWPCLLQVTSWCLRFISKCSLRLSNKSSVVTQPISASQSTTPVACQQHKNPVAVPELSVEELSQAEQYWCVVAQCEAFGSSYQAALAGKSLSRADPLLPLQPQSLSAAIPLLIVSGRLDNASHLPQRICHRVVLPQEHRATELIIAGEDDKCHHGADHNGILTDLSSKYWIVHDKQAVKRRRAKCNTCRCRWMTGCTQVMGQLSMLRTARS